jgi:hypothetical protein
MPSIKEPRFGDDASDTDMKPMRCILFGKVWAPAGERSTASAMTVAGNVKRRSDFTASAYFKWNKQSKYQAWPSIFNGRSIAV